MRDWLTADELSGLPGLPATARRVRSKAERDNWESQNRTFGKGYEYHISNLPPEARKALQAREIDAMMPRLHESKELTLKPASTLDSSLNARQRAVCDARATIIRAIDAMSAQGVTKAAAICTLITQGETGQLLEINPILDKALRLAKDPRGNSNSDYPSARSIKRWLATDLKALAPKSKKPIKIPNWANAFLICWQRPEKPTVEHAYRLFSENFEGNAPSIHAVRRFINKMGSVAKNKGRMGARDLKNVLPFVRRDFSKLLPGDIYSADGHTFDAEVQHPLHGQPFRPEVTTFIDIATRRAVGVSVDLAESSIAVLDALISSCTQAIPAIIYVDNGGGYANSLLKDEATGVLARLGSTMSHSLPYSSQARGVIERVHKTLWVDGAKALPGYIGSDMDDEARQRQFKLSRDAVKHGGRMELLGWAAFMDFVNQRMDWYNARPHSSLPKITDIGGKRRHMSPDECWEQHQRKGWAPELLSADEAANVFRPRTTRTVRRCEIKFINNIYFSQALMEWNGEQVQIAYDINNADTIWVYEPEHGYLICKAEWNANQVDYMPQSLVDDAREKRAKGRLRRIDAKRQEVLDELNGQPVLEQVDASYIPGLGGITVDQLSADRGVLVAQHSQSQDVKAAQSPEKKTVNDMTTAERIALYQEYQAKGEAPSDHAWWFENYPKSKEFSAWQKRKDEGL